MTSVLAFIDAAVIAYTRYDAPQRPACTEIMSWVADGRLPAITSVLVIEEVWHLEYRGPAGAARGNRSGSFRTVPRPAQRDAGPAARRPGVPAVESRDG